MKKSVVSCFIVLVFFMSASAVARDTPVACVGHEVHDCDEMFSDDDEDRCEQYYQPVSGGYAQCKWENEACKADTKYGDCVEPPLSLT